jgi:hypothetical protein
MRGMGILSLLCFLLFHLGYGLVKGRVTPASSCESVVVPREGQTVEGGILLAQRFDEYLPGEAADFLPALSGHPEFDPRDRRVQILVSGRCFSRHLISW